MNIARDATGTGKMAGNIRRQIESNAGRKAANRLKHGKRNLLNNAKLKRINNGMRI
jgi:hypothetical protein